MALPEYMEILFFILMLLVVSSQYKQYFFFKIRSKSPWTRDALAQQMTHRATTEDQFYLLKQTKCDSAKIVKLIEKCMTQDEVHTCKTLDSEDIRLFALYCASIL